MSEVTERIRVDVPARTAYEAVAEVRRMARWSPECVAVWIWRRKGGTPWRFIGWNRRGFYLWFTTCQTRVAEPGREFAFDVTTFGFPVARWGYRFAEVAGGVEVEEYWQDRRGRPAYVLGRIFTGKATNVRPEVNRAGMRQTLERLKTELEG